MATHNAIETTTKFLLKHGLIRHQMLAGSKVWNYIKASIPDLSLKIQVQLLCIGGEVIRVVLQTPIPIFLEITCSNAFEILLQIY